MARMKIGSMERPLFNGSQKTASQLPLPEDVEAFAQAMKTSSNDTLGAIVQQQGKTATNIPQPSTSLSQNVSGKGTEAAPIQAHTQEVSPSLMSGQERNLSQTTASRPFGDTRQTQNSGQTVSARTEAPVNKPSERLVVSRETQQQGKTTAGMAPPRDSQRQFSVERPAVGVGIQQQGKVATDVSSALTSRPQNLSGKGTEVTSIQAHTQEVSPSLMPGRENILSQTTTSRPFESTKQTQNPGQTVSARTEAPVNRPSERLVVSTETQQQGKTTAGMAPPKDSQRQFSVERPAVGVGIQQQGKTATDVSPALTSRPQNLSGKGAEPASIQVRTQEVSPSMMPGRESNLSRATASRSFENTRQTQNLGQTVSARVETPVNRPSERLVVGTETQQQERTTAGMTPPTGSQHQFSVERPAVGAGRQQQGKTATDVSPGKRTESMFVQAYAKEVSPSLMPGRERDLSQTTASRPFEDTRQTQNPGQTVSARTEAPVNRSSEELVVSTETQQQGRVTAEMVPPTDSQRQFSVERSAVSMGIQQQGRAATDVSPALTSQSQSFSEGKMEEISPSFVSGPESAISHTAVSQLDENMKQAQTLGQQSPESTASSVARSSEKVVVNIEAQQQGRTTAETAQSTINQQQFSLERPAVGVEVQQQGKTATDVSPALASQSQNLSEKGAEPVLSQVRMEGVASAANIQQQIPAEKVLADIHPDKKGLQLDGERLLQAMDREEKRETSKHRESSLPPITGPLDGLLGTRMEGKAEASEKVAPTVNSHTVSEIAQKCVERILVSRPENGASEVRLQMGHDILPDTEIRLSRGVDGQLTVSMYTGNETSFQSMVAMRNDLLDNLQHQEKDTKVRVEISFQNNAETGDMNRRSRGYVQQQDDTQQAG